MDDRLQKNRMTRGLGRAFVVLSLVTSWGAQATVESVPPIIKYCGIIVTVTECSFLYDTALASAQAWVATEKLMGIIAVIVSCDGTKWAGRSEICYQYSIGPNEILPLPLQKTNPSCPLPSSKPNVHFQYNYATGMCERPAQQTLTITLSGSNEVEPSKDADIKFLPIIASVKDQSTGLPPTTPVTVKVSLKVDPPSGGHAHGDNTRPRGGITDNGIVSSKNCPSDATCWSKQTDASGQVEFNFKAPEAAGKHTISVSCDGCTNNPQEKPVDVKVGGLSPIPASAFYAFIGGGDGKLHLDNHYLTPNAAAVLWEMAISYQVNPQFKWRDKLSGQLISPQILQVNDASLEWGGVFDAVNANWVPPHHEHRRGTVVDLRANDAPGAILPRNFIEFDTYLDMQKIKYMHECAKDKRGTPPASRHNRLWPGCISKLDGSMDINRHYHVRLLGVSE